LAGDGDTSPADSPSQLEGDPADAPSQADLSRSVLEDVEELLVDARTWFDAEVTYQKTRAGFVGSSLKFAFAFGIGALIAVLLLLVALTVGLLIALTPLVTAWGATAIVVVSLGLVAILLMRAASNRWRELMGAIRENKES
jgi:hypothetical protein